MCGDNNKRLLGFTSHYINVFDVQNEFIKSNYFYKIRSIKQM